jgi:predicted metal-binding membrane protein
MTARLTQQGALLLGSALVAWIVTVERMSGMDMGPGTNLGGFGWFVGIWVTMMAAMMLPSALPMIQLFDKVARRSAEGRRQLPTSVFVASYFAVWTAFGLAAFVVYRVVAGLHLAFLAWNRAGPYIAGGAIVLAGLYELTPVKSVCLRHCRSPLHYLLGGWRPGIVGAVRMGAEHGAYCVGCCWGLMLLLFALGVMSLFWMAVVAALIFVQKALPFGLRTTRVFAVAFLALGVWVAVAPASVPQLTQPNSNAANRARMQMMPSKPAANTGMRQPGGRMPGR